jgi:plasmid stabilization system protein ParE
VGRGRGAADAIDQGLRQLEALPESAPKLAGSTVRELPIRFGRRGYVIRYGVIGERVIVIRIFHASEQRWFTRS